MAQLGRADRGWPARSDRWPRAADSSGTACHAPLPYWPGTGKVWAVLRVSDQGRVTEVHFLSGTSGKIHKEALISMWKKWRFVPASEDGRPCDGLVVVPCEFTVEAR